MCFHKYCPHVATDKFQDSSIQIPYSFIEHVLGPSSVSGLTLGAGDNQGDQAIYVDGPCPRGTHSLVGKINIEIIVWDQQTVSIMQCRRSPGSCGSREEGSFLRFRRVREGFLRKQTGIRKVRQELAWQSQGDKDF